MELIVLGVVAGLSFLSYALWKRSRTEGTQEALEGDRVIARLAGAEPSIHTLRPGDVVSHLQTDYVVEGVLSLDDDGRITRLYRMADGGRVRWLGVKPGAEEPLFLDEVTGLEMGVEVSAPDQLTHAGAPYRLAARASARVNTSGSVGPNPPGARAFFYEYAGAGARRLFALASDGRTNAYEGEPVATGMIEILPGT